MGWFDCFWGAADVRRFKERMETLVEDLNADYEEVEKFARQFQAETSAKKLECRQCLQEDDTVGAKLAVREALNRQYLRDKALKRCNWLGDQRTKLWGMYMSRANHENDKHHIAGMRKLAKNEDPEKLERAVEDIEAGLDDFNALANEIEAVIDQPFDTREFVVVQDTEVDDALAEWFPEYEEPVEPPLQITRRDEQAAQAARAIAAPQQVPVQPVAVQPVAAQQAPVAVQPVAAQQAPVAVQQVPVAAVGEQLVYQEQEAQPPVGQTDDNGAAEPQTADDDHDNDSTEGDEQALLAEVLE